MAASPTLTEKLRWRMEFLVKPARFTGKELDQLGFVGSARADLIRDASTLRLRERLRFITPAGERRTLADWLLLRRMRRGANGERWFDLAGRHVHVPRWTGASALGGMLLVLKEAYLMPQEFFSRDVAIQPGDVVFDLGGHVGTSALLFSRLTGPAGRVFSFEPAFFDVLSRNVIVNDADNVTVVPCAVAATPGEQEFDVTDLGIDSRLAEPGSCTDGSVRVPVTSVDHFVAREDVARVDFMKLDIEGSEEEALVGAEQTLRRMRPRLSVASYHTDRRGRAQHGRLVRLLRGLGYRTEEVGRKRIYAW